MNIIFHFIGLIAVVLASAGSSISQQEDYFKKDYLRNSDYMYEESIRSVQLYRSGWETSYPVIKLGTDETLTLEFDDLVPELKDYVYSIFHCDRNWNKSDLVHNEYMNGLEYDFINDYEFSGQSKTRYVHYKFVFPNTSMKPRLSGNYMVVVWMNDNMEKPILSKRMIINEDKVDVQANVHPATDAEQHYYQQEVDFKLFERGYSLADPFQSLFPVVIRNGNWNEIKTDLQPLFLKNGELDYDLEDVNVFWAGNEFRHFNMQSLRHKSERIMSIQNDSLGIHAILDLDKKRSTLAYASMNDINGRHVYRIEGPWNPYTDGDYAWVEFELECNPRIANGDVYVSGNFSNYVYEDWNKMNYNSESNSYEASILLKQGYYNYRYDFVPDGNKEVSERTIEGTHSKTENDYSIIVYHRPFAGNYDKVIAFETFNSTRR